MNQVKKHITIGNLIAICFIIFASIFIYDIFDLNDTDVLIINPKNEKCKNCCNDDIDCYKDWPDYVGRHSSNKISTICDKSADGNNSCSNRYEGCCITRNNIGLIENYER